MGVCACLRFFTPLQKCRNKFFVEVVRFKTLWKIPMDDPRIQEWEKKQNEIRQKVITWDTEGWQKLKLLEEEPQCRNMGAVRYVAGMDISFVKSSDSTACTALVVCELPSLKVVYKNCEWVELTMPYIAGFLTFREAESLITIFKELVASSTEYLPQLSLQYIGAVLIDGNGILHSRGCGLACHIGVELNVPTIGVAKNLCHVDGIAKNEGHKEKISSLTSKGDTFPLIGESGHTLGLALKSSEKADKPIYVSVGHKISAETAAWLVTKCCIYRVPEPIRQADQLSREAVRLKYPEVARS